MLSSKLKHRSLPALAAAGAMFLAATASQAAILPATAELHSTPPDIQLAWCAVGAHIGPVGACIGGPGYYGHRGYWHGHCWINRWGHRVCN
jgi:hypothetical protein